jgi:hypothetical protein
MKRVIVIALSVILALVVATPMATAKKAEKTKSFRQQGRGASTCERAWEARSSGELLKLPDSKQCAHARDPVVLHRADLPTEFRALC